MPLFALPLAPSTTIHHSASTRPVSFRNLASRKRKRASLSPKFSNEDDEHSSPPARSQSITSTNPLSLAPADVVQYQLAGLELDQELPSARTRDFPHRGLEGDIVPTTIKQRKDRKGKGKLQETDAGAGDDDDDPNEGVEIGERDVKGDLEVKQIRAEQGPRLRLQHQGVLTTILHRCLLEGDIARASRAWAMLIRTQVGGRGIDLRGSGYWGIGAELLMQAHSRHPRPSYDSDAEEGGSMDVDVDRDAAAAGAERRWGTAEGWEKAKDYYERLILQFPYNRQFQGVSVSALDFWPAMVACEIYGVQYEQREGLRRLALAADAAENGGGNAIDESEEEEEADDVAQANHEEPFAVGQRRMERRRRRKGERFRSQREEVRQSTLVASEKIAARLDELMATPPYSDSHNLLHLRGMLALYIGDLDVPEKPFHDPEMSDAGGNDAERRIFSRQQLSDHERGRRRREEEYERARRLFERIAREGGDVADVKDIGREDQEFYDAEE